jgi:opacity protein-like surface antigen
MAVPATWGFFILEVAMFRLTSLLSVLIASGILSPLAGADSAGMFAPERVGRWYLGGGVGGYWEESNSQLRNQDGKAGGFVSGGYRLSTNVALEIDGLVSSQELGQVATLPVTPDHTYLNTAGLGGVAKFILPLNRIELYAGAGLGIYTTQLRAEGSTLTVSQDDTNIGLQALLGADYFFSRTISVGLEYRKLKVRADFAPTLPGKIDAGGDFLLATVRAHF